MQMGNKKQTLTITANMFNTSSCSLRPLPQNSNTQKISITLHFNREASTSNIVLLFSRILSRLSFLSPKLKIKKNFNPKYFIMKMTFSRSTENKYRSMEDACAEYKTTLYVWSVFV